MLDALVGNTDRHDENWGIVRESGGVVRLAPTFDHASSLGRNESDEMRTERLETRDVGRSVSAYAARAKSALYAQRDNPRPLSTHDAFREFAETHDGAVGNGWLSKLESVPAETFDGIFSEFPDGWISVPAIEFALALLRVNREKLLDGR
jgi:hypothetical protein